MRVLVDSSVWIHFLKGRQAFVRQMENLIQPDNRVVLTGIIIQEVLQGIADPDEFDRVLITMRHFPEVQPSDDTHIAAARLHQRMRQSGLNLPTIDLLLAAIAREHRLSIYSCDKHFEFLSAANEIRMYAPE